jgi:hypothetical protein
MPCPACGATAGAVIETRAAHNAIRRRRACPACSHRWTTYEMDGALFKDLHKLLDGLVRPRSRGNLAGGRPSRYVIPAARAAEYKTLRRQVGADEAARMLGLALRASP